MFSKKIIIKPFKITPENFQTHLTFVAICIPIVFHGTLENFIITEPQLKIVLFFSQSAMNQTITFNTSLDSEKKTFIRLSLKNYVSI
jgi:hypothetical protein